MPNINISSIAVPFKAYSILRVNKLYNKVITVKYINNRPHKQEIGIILQYYV